MCVIFNSIPKTIEISQYYSKSKEKGNQLKLIKIGNRKSIENDMFLTKQI
jgi:hypothetical protein